jgi:signal transduction histidine kinase
VNPADLRKSPLFQSLSDEELQRLVDSAKPVSLRAGKVLIKQGEPGGKAYFIIKGEFDVQKLSGQTLVQIDVRGPGDVVGEMALISHARRSATITARTDAEVLSIPRETFEELLSTSPTAAMTILRWVMARLAQNEALLHQHEKLAALGTLSAGLAHELNNPAAAAQRSASELNKAVSKWQALTHEIETRAHREGQTDWLDGLRREISQRNEAPIKLEALDRIDEVDQLQAWLEANGVRSAWEIAPAMVSFGWSADMLERLKGNPLFDLSIQWIGAGCLVLELLREVEQTTARLSQIVQAMKSYTYLDQASVLEVDVHEGLENTLIIMQHKLKQGVNVKREYAPDLPRIEAYASELNQVWTNIIDNAVEAMNGSGEIILRTYAEGDRIVVEISDNGPGVPAEIQGRIFEPFFTTKPPGKGTGLGLHISHEIIANRHCGQLLVESEPGRTTFRAVLPRKMPAPN